MLLVFTFVALWHDLSLHLLAWGWLTVLFALPEIIASRILPEKKVSRALNGYEWRERENTRLIWSEIVTKIAVCGNALV